MNLQNDQTKYIFKSETFSTDTESLTEMQITLSSFVHFCPSSFLACHNSLHFQRYYRCIQRNAPKKLQHIASQAFECFGSTPKKFRKSWSAWPLPYLRLPNRFLSNGTFCDLNTKRRIEKLRFIGAADKLWVENSKRSELCPSLWAKMLHGNHCE